MTRVDIIGQMVNGGDNDMRTRTRTFWTVLAGGLALAATMFAQPGASFRAQIRGGVGDHGKCTIEVRGDDVAESEIQGAQGRMRARSANPSVSLRLRCNEPLPPTR